MAMLVLVNGPPASGKSTLAAHLAERHPMTLNLDVDMVRCLLGAWQSDLLEAGLTARRLELVLAATHLAEGRDVIVPQFLAREQFILQLAAVADQAGARFVEVALTLSKSDAVESFRQRSDAAQTQQHRDAADDVERFGGVAALEGMYDDYTALLERRPTARRVAVARGDLAGAIDLIVQIMSERR